MYFRCRVAGMGVGRVGKGIKNEEKPLTGFLEEMIIQLEEWIIS